MQTWQSSLFKEYPWVVHGTSTRAFGSCRYPNAEETDDPWQENRARFLQSLGLDPTKLIVSGNAHDGYVAPIMMPAESCSAGRIEGIDALMTAQSGISLGVKSADCLPVFVVDPVHRVVGLAHAGWKGIVAEIIPHLIGAMASLGSHPKDLLVAIGPSIGLCHYDIHQERHDELVTAVPGTPPSASVELGGGRYRCDLFELARHQLLASGLATDHIAERPPCTACHPDLFPSYFAQKDKQQGMLSVIGIRG